MKWHAEKHKYNVVQLEYTLPGVLKAFLQLRVAIPLAEDVFTEYFMLVGPLLTLRSNTACGSRHEDPMHEAEEEKDGGDFSHGLHCDK